LQRLAIVLALTALLGGCFASKGWKFSPSSAVPVLGDGGRYATFERDEGKEKPSDPLVVRRRADGGYDFIDEKGTTTPVTFHAIPGGLHVAQVKLDGEQGYGYVLTRVTDRELVVIPAECDKQEKARMQALGVEEHSRFECRIDKISDPAAFFAALKTGEPVSRMVRE
jgi:hypothetical protein